MFPAGGEKHRNLKFMNILNSIVTIGLSYFYACLFQKINKHILTRPAIYVLKVQIQIFLPNIRGEMSVHSILVSTAFENEYS